MIDRLREMIGRQIYVEISKNRGYNGTIKEVCDTHIVFNDKFGEDLFILISEIKLLQPKDRQIDGNPKLQPA